jgi:hypothetical protein
MRNYKILIHNQVYEKARRYLEFLKEGHGVGGHLKQQLAKQEVRFLGVESLIELLIQTKRPQIFAESELRGDGSDWNQQELSILGDINIATPVTVFDDGKHAHPNIHHIPLDATLLFTPGALLRNDTHNTPADWDEVTEKDDLSWKKYYRLYERRLLPLLQYASESAINNGRMAFITVPGIGCGQFAGPFRGSLGGELKNALKKLLKNHGKGLSGIKGVYFDPYNECQNERIEIHDICFMVRPFTHANESKPQLCEPGRYEEEGDDFSNCDLFSMVAWDHVSWPGNDYYIGSRATDDGVKAAATSSMSVMTGVEGTYDMRLYQYQPPAEYRNWAEVVSTNKIQIVIHDNLLVY